MAYKLKSTGIAANCTMCIAVDPDTNTIKDFASAGVTADMTVGTHTITSQTWDGNSRKGWVMDTDQYLAFGATKPALALDTTNNQLTMVALVEHLVTTNVRVFGEDSSNLFQSTAGATDNHPKINWTPGSRTGAFTNPALNEKRIFGFSCNHNSTIVAYTALHDDAAMTKNTTLTDLGTGIEAWDLDYIGRQTDSTSQAAVRFFGVFLFNVALTEAQWDSLRDDWFNTLLEVDGGGGSPPTAPTIGNVTSITSGGATINWTDNSADETGFKVEYATSPYNSWTPANNSPAGANATSLAITGLAQGTTYKARVAATNANGDSTWVETAEFTTLTRKLRVAIEAAAAGATGVSGVVWAAQVGGIAGAEIGEFSGKSFEAALDGGLAVLKVPVADFGGSALTTSDTPVALVRNSTNTTGVVPCTVIEE